MEKGERAANKRPKHQVLLSAALIILLGGVGGTVVYRQLHTNKPVKNPMAKDQKIETPKSTDQQYNSVRNQNNPAAATAVLKQQLESAQTAQAKIEALSLLGHDALGNKDYAAAEDYANKLLGLDPKSDSAYIILARSSAAQGNSADAKKYLTEAINSLDKNVPQYDMVLREYESYKKELNL